MIGFALLAALSSPPILHQEAGKAHFSLPTLLFACGTTSLPKRSTFLFRVEGDEEKSSAWVIAIEKQGWPAKSITVLNGLNAIRDFKTEKATVADFQAVGKSGSHDYTIDFTLNVPNESQNGDDGVWKINLAISDGSSKVLADCGMMATQK